MSLNGVSKSCVRFSPPKGSLLCSEENSRVWYSGSGVGQGRRPCSRTTINHRVRFASSFFYLFTFTLAFITLYLCLHICVGCCLYCHDDWLCYSCRLILLRCALLYNMIDYIIIHTPHIKFNLIDDLIQNVLRFQKENILT